MGYGEVAGRGFLDAEVRGARHHQHAPPPEDCLLGLSGRLTLNFTISSLSVLIVSNLILRAGDLAYR